MGMLYPASEKLPALLLHSRKDEPRERGLQADRASQKGYF